MPNKRFLFIFLAVFITACSDLIVESQYQSIADNGWHKDSTIKFQFSAQDSITPFNVFLQLRNDNDFAYSNLFLITEMEFPSGRVIKDTLEYEMALADGKWLGEGNGSLKESKLWYKEKIVFPTKGVYTLQISHAMRKNGSVAGIKQLEGITDVGFQIEKTE